MTQAKHTPGPWIQAALSPTDVITNDNTMVAMAREGLNGIEHDQAIANARLIAASPTMFDYIIARSALGDAEASAILESINAAR